MVQNSPSLWKLSPRGGAQNVFDLSLAASHVIHLKNFVEICPLF